MDFNRLCDKPSGWEVGEVPQWVPASPAFSELLAPVGKEIQTLFLIFGMTPVLRGQDPGFEELRGVVKRILKPVLQVSSGAKGPFYHRRIKGTTRSSDIAVSGRELCTQKVR